MKITIIKPKTSITMKPNNFTFSIFPFSPSRFTLHASPFFPAAVAQEFPVDTCNLFMPSKPNFQNTRLSVTLAMIRTYNDNCPKKHKKSKPNPNPIRTRSKPDPNPIQTQSKPKTNHPHTQRGQAGFFRIDRDRCRA